MLLLLLTHDITIVLRFISHILLLSNIGLIHAKSVMKQKQHQTSSEVCKIALAGMIDT